MLVEGLQLLKAVGGQEIHIHIIQVNHPRLDSDEVYREGDGAGKTPKQRNARLENLASC